jgi:thiamine biosynthesis lipoprotein
LFASRQKLFRRSVVLLVAAAAVAALAGCRPGLYRESRLAMSTTLTVMASTRSAPEWDALFKAADHRAWEFDHRYPDSPIGELNRRGSAVLPPEVFSVVSEAVVIATLSDGAFDPTILPLTALWSFDTGGRLPEPTEIREALSRVDYRRIDLEPQGKVSLPLGFGLDLGGIAKGAVVDLLAAVLDEKVGPDYLIDAGGDILVSGLKEGTRPWVIAIQHPRDSQRFVGKLSLGVKGEKLAVVTSGDYERYFEQDGRRYHHILDPRTGYPAEGPASVTVIAPTCTMADGLATAVFVLGAQRGLALLESLPGAEGLILSEAPGGLGAVATSGFPLSVDQLSLE